MNSYNFDQSNTQSFYTMAWISFAISFVGMSVGIFYMNVDMSLKGFLLMSYLFSVTSCFTVAKVVRDRHETEKQENDRQFKKYETQ